MRAIDVRYNKARFNHYDKQALEDVKRYFEDDEPTEEEIKRRLSECGCPSEEEYWFNHTCSHGRSCFDCWSQSHDNLLDCEEEEQWEE